MHMKEKRKERKEGKRGRRKGRKKEGKTASRTLICSEEQIKENDGMKEENKDG